MGVEMASIRQLNNSKWQAQIRRTGHKPITNTFINKSDAAMWARQVESEIDRGIFLDRTEADSTSMAELFSRYLIEVTPHKLSASREKSRLAILKAHFGYLMVTQVQSKHVAQYRDLRMNTGLTGATVIKELNTLSHVIDTATKDWGLPITANPVKLIRKPKAARGRDRRLSSIEEEQLLTACRQSKAPMLVAIVLFDIETGMRLSELLGLNWVDINFFTRVATLHHTKNGEVRMVPLSTKAIRLLENLPRHISNTRVFWEWKSVDSFEHTWHRAVLKSSIVNFRFHDLRHEATSRLFEGGMNMMEVATITGHKTLQMLKRYTHLKAEDLAKKLG